MLSVLLRSVTARGAEIAQKAHHVMIMLWRRRADAEDPVEQIGVGAIEQRFESVELRSVQALEWPLDKRAEDEITLLCPAVPALEPQPPAADIQMFAL